MFSSASTISSRPMSEPLYWGPAQSDPEHPLHPAYADGAPDQRDVSEQRPDDN